MRNSTKFSKRALRGKKTKQVNRETRTKRGNRGNRDKRGKRGSNNKSTRKRMSKKGRQMGGMKAIFRGQKEQLDYRKINLLVDTLNKYYTKLSKNYETPFEREYKQAAVQRAISKLRDAPAPPKRSSSAGTAAFGAASEDDTYEMPVMPQSAATSGDEPEYEYGPTPGADQGPLYELPPDDAAYAAVAPEPLLSGDGGVKIPKTVEKVESEREAVQGEVSTGNTGEVAPDE